MESEKYSLRQRQKRKHLGGGGSGGGGGSSTETQGYASDNSNESAANASAGRERVGAASSLATAATVAKAKSKAAPLSKYRRKTANARERTRMREINSAFENLRHCVPPCITSEDAASTNEKLTKITTLRLAMKYITILSEALSNPDGADYDFLYAWTQPARPTPAPAPAPHDTPPACPERPSKGTKSSKSSAKATAKPAARGGGSGGGGSASRKAPSKRHSRKQKLQQSAAPYVAQVARTRTAACRQSPNGSNGSSRSSRSSGSSGSSAYASLGSDASASPLSNSSSYLYDSNGAGSAGGSFGYSNNNHHQTVSELSDLMLESDGESLHLSESCTLSPHLAAAHRPDAVERQQYEASPNAPLPTLDNPLELSLRMLEPGGDVLGLTADQPPAPPTPCLSPLMGLEPFAPFDLFHSDFPEQTALDLFLT